jgi:hypothetical protein
MRTPRVSADPRAWQTGGLYPQIPRSVLHIHRNVGWVILSVARLDLYPREMTRKRVRVLFTLVLSLTILGVPSQAQAAQDITVNFSTGNNVTWSLGNFNLTEVSTNSTVDSYHGDGFDADLDLYICANESCTTTTGSYSSYAPVGTYDAVNQTYTGAVQAINGLNVSGQYRISKTKAAGRLLSTFQNTSGAPITRVIKYYRNLGSDGSTTLKYTSDTQTISNQTLSRTGTNALWFIHSDNTGLVGNEVPSDPINSFVYGTAGAAVSPITDFNAGSANTIYKITVPANSIVRILIAFGVANVDNTQNTHAGAFAGLKANLEDFSKLPTDITSDIDNSTLATIQNWLTAPPGPADVSISLTASATTASKGTPITITTAVSQAGLVTFFWNGKKIPGCIKKAAVTSVTCIWKPAVTGQASIWAYLDPTNPNFVDSYSPKLPVFILRRGGTR